MDKKYFDYAATTPVEDEVLDIFQKVSKKYYMNNINDEDSYELAKECEDRILSLLGLGDDYEVIFTSSGTEANNLSVIGRFLTSSKKHLVTTKVEHPSMYESFRTLEKNGHSVDYLSVDKSGQISLESVLNIVTDKTAAISVMTLNNEIGCRYSVNEIFAEVKKVNPNIITITDCVQGIGKVKIDMENIDMITFSAHKIYGLKGSGILVKKKSILLEQQIYGSKSLIRPGTYPVSLKVSSAKVFKEAIEESAFRQEEIKKRCEYFLDNLNMDNVTINGDYSYGIISLTLDVEAFGETIANVLFERGIVVSTRSACSQKANTRSYVLEALGLSNDEIDKTIRVSLSHKTKYEDLDELIKSIDYIIDNFK